MLLSSKEAFEIALTKDSNSVRSSLALTPDSNSLTNSSSLSASIPLEKPSVQHTTTYGLSSNGISLQKKHSGEKVLFRQSADAVTFDENFTTFVSGKSYEDLNLKNNIKLDTTNGTLRFIGVNSMTIYETVDVVVKVTVDYPWGRKVGDIVVTIPANA